ncbi:MAG: flavodoxin family protein [Eubacteriales bacterium]|nr:flavodoxin family protein [Eubacteriales bacterium]
MKTLLLNGSPHPHGDTAALVDALTRQLGGEIVAISAYFDNIGPCIDCRYCWKHPGCSQEDGMQAVYRAIDTCDIVLIASPVHYSELSGPLVSLGGRLQTYYAAQAFRGEKPLPRTKKGAILLCGGGDGSAKKALSTATTFLHQMGAEVVGSVFSLRTNTLGAGQDTDALEAAAALGRKLAAGDAAQR